MLARHGTHGGRLDHLAVANTGSACVSNGRRRTAPAVRARAVPSAARAGSQAARLTQAGEPARCASSVPAAAQGNVPCPSRLRPDRSDRCDALSGGRSRGRSRAHLRVARPRGGCSRAGREGGAPRRHLGVMQPPAGDVAAHVCAGPRERPPCLAAAAQRVARAPRHRERGAKAAPYAARRRRRSSLQRGLPSVGRAYRGFRITAGTRGVEEDRRNGPPRSAQLLQHILPGTLAGA